MVYPGYPSTQGTPCVPVHHPAPRSCSSKLVGGWELPVGLRQRPGPGYLIIKARKGPNGVRDRGRLRPLSAAAADLNI